MWIKYWLLWFEIILVFILFKLKKHPNISGNSGCINFSRKKISFFKTGFVSAYIWLFCILKYSILCQEIILCIKFKQVTLALCYQNIAHGCISQKHLKPFKVTRFIVTNIVKWFSVFWIHSSTKQLQTALQTCGSSRPVVRSIVSC